MLPGPAVYKHSEGRAVSQHPQHPTHHHYYGRHVPVNDDDRDIAFWLQCPYPAGFLRDTPQAGLQKEGPTLAWGTVRIS